MKNLFTIYLLLLSTFLFAQEIKYSFNKQRILLGEPIKVTVNATVEEHSSFVFSTDTFPHFEVLERSKIDSNRSNGMLLLSQIITITSWDSGRWNLPSLVANNRPSKPISIDVVYTSPWSPDKPYNDIKGIIPVKSPDKDEWWWYVIGIAVLVALFLLFFPQEKNNKTVSELDSDAYKKAMLSLDKLQKEGTSATNVKQYYTELITIFRTYLKGAKGIQSFSKTTDDLSIQLQQVKQLQTNYNALVQTLRLSDLVKFAQYQPEERLNAASLDIIKQSIISIEDHNAV